MERLNCINKAQATQIKHVVWFCAACGKANVKSARFCGSCGRSPLQAVQEAAAVENSPSDMGFPNSESPVFAPESSEVQSSGLVMIKNKIVALSESFASFVDEQLQKRLHKKFNKKRAKKLAIVIVASSCLFSAIWYQTSGSRDTGSVRWGDLRSFVSQRLVIAPVELDDIFKTISLSEADAKTTVNVSQVVMLESALRQKLGDRELRLFPNPFFGNASAFLGEVVFTDVALDHPVYMALQPLIELGIKVCDENMHIRPYERISWSDWQQVVGDLVSLLGIEKAELPGGSHGVLDNNDLKFYLAHLRRKLFMGGIDKLSDSSAVGFPSRLEALSSLSAIVAELNSAR